MSVPFGHGLSRTSFDRRNGDLWRTEHPVIIPLVIAVRSLQCVALARVGRARSSHSTFHVTHRGHRVTCRNCRSGSWGRTLLSNQRQTLSTVGLECAKLLASNSWKNSWLGSSACALFLMVRLVPTPTNGCLTGRNCLLTARATDATDVWRRCSSGACVCDPQSSSFRSQSSARTPPFCHRVPGRTQKIDHGSGTTDECNPELEAPSPFRRHYTTDIARNSWETWDEDGLRQGTGASWRAEDVTHVDGLVGTDRFWRRGVSRAERKRVRWNNHGRRWRQHQNGRTERTRETREENPEIILAVNFAWHWKNAALDSAKKLLTVPKNAEKFAKDDSVSHAHAAAELPASHQGKEKDRNASATSERCGRCSVPIVERVGDLFTCIVSLRDGRPARQALCRIDCQYLFPVPISSPSGPDV